MRNQSSGEPPTPKLTPRLTPTMQNSDSYNEELEKEDKENK